MASSITLITDEVKLDISDHDTRIESVLPYECQYDSQCICRGHIHFRNARVSVDESIDFVTNKYVFYPAPSQIRLNSSKAIHC